MIMTEKSSSAGENWSPLNCIISGAFGRAVLKQLCAMDMAISQVVDLDKGESLSGLPKGDCLVILDFERPEVSTALRDRGLGEQNWLFTISLLRDTLFIGPHFRPGLPGCPECFSRRLLSTNTLDDAGRLHKLETMHLRRKTALRPGYSPILPALAARAFLAHSSGPEADKHNRFLRFLHDGSFREDGRLFALHGCKCRELPSRNRVKRGADQLLTALGIDTGKVLATSEEGETC